MDSLIAPQKYVAQGVLARRFFRAGKALWRVLTVGEGEDSGRGLAGQEGGRNETIGADVRASVRRGNLVLKLHAADGRARA